HAGPGRPSARGAGRHDPRSRRPRGLLLPAPVHRRRARGRGRARAAGHGRRRRRRLGRQPGWRHRDRGRRAGARRRRPHARRAVPAAHAPRRRDRAHLALQRDHRLPRDAPRRRRADVAHAVLLRRRQLRLARPCALAVVGGAHGHDLPAVDGRLLLQSRRLPGRRRGLHLQRPRGRGYVPVRPLARLAARALRLSPTVPLFDLPLAELEWYRPDVEEPVDFDAFWERTLAEARRHDLALRLRPVDAALARLEVHDVTFAGFGGHPIKAWYVRPARLPVVVSFAGYSAGRGKPWDHTLFPAAGYGVLRVDARGQGWTAPEPGDTGDPVGHGPAQPGFLTRGLEDPEGYYYRRLYTDAARAVDAARALPGADPEKVVVAGTSQGGG